MPAEASRVHDGPGPATFMLNSCRIRAEFMPDSCRPAPAAPTSRAAESRPFPNGSAVQDEARAAPAPAARTISGPSTEDDGIPTARPRI